MKKHVLGALLVLLAHAGWAAAQGLSAKWEELTGPDFVRALDSSKGTCALPFGIIEKHGPAGPLGTDLFNVRYTTGLAAKEEYTIIFPEYYVGQIFEARHQPGTIAYSARLQLEMLQETVSEMAQRLPEDHHRERPRREQLPTAVLRADTARFAQGLRGLRGDGLRFRRRHAGGRSVIAARG